MSGLVSRHYGVALDELGHVEHDDTVWLTVRRNKPLLVDSPDEQERAQHRAHRAARARARHRARPASAPTPPPIPTEEPTLYAVLGVTRSASDEEIRRAYKRQREIYATGGLATVSLLDERAARGARSASSTRRTTRCSIRSAAAPTTSRRSPSRSREVLSARTTRPALAAEQLMLQEELQREIGPDTEFTGRAPAQGARVAGPRARRDQRRRRRSRARTCRRIEDERFDDLPALVYTRGFLVELAKQLRLDPAQVQKTYLRRMREELATRGKELA